MSYNTNYISYLAKKIIIYLSCKYDDGSNVNPIVMAQKNCQNIFRIQKYYTINIKMIIILFYVHNNAPI